MLKRLLHFSVVLVAFLFWVIGTIPFTIAFLISLLADKIDPNSRWGNCWTFVAPQVLKQRKPVLITKARGPNFLGFLPIPHIALVHSLGEGAVIEQSFPLKRGNSQILPTEVIYFPFTVRKKKETQHVGIHPTEG